MGLNQTQFGLVAGRTKGAVSQWESEAGLPDREASESLAKAGVNMEYIFYGTGQMMTDPPQRLDTQPLTSIASNTAPATAPRQIPLISWVHAGEASEAIDDYPPGYAEEWVLAAGPLHANAYALRIVGDSMTPEFWPGQTIVIDPEGAWRSGSYVIVKNGDNEVVLRQIVRDIGGWMLVPANKAYPPVPLGSYHVIGVVRWSQKQYL